MIHNKRKLLDAMPKSHRMLFYLMYFLMFFAFFMYTWGFQYVANQMAKDPSNFKEGCLSYDSSRKHKSGIAIYTLSIDGYKSSNIYARSFPLNSKYSEFNEFLKANPTMCHQVKYIEINLLVTRQIYVYEYMGEFK